MRETSPLARVEDRVSPHTPETIHAARVAVCARAASPAEARQLLSMLGLLPAPEISVSERVPLVFNPGVCVMCGIGMDGSRPATRYGGKGRCERCYQRQRRADRKAGPNNIENKEEAS